jgi:hypothetical protein
VSQILTQFPILFDIVFPLSFQSWIDSLAIISLDLYTFVGIHCVMQGSSVTVNSVEPLVLQIRPQRLDLDSR